MRATTSNACLNDVHDEFGPTLRILSATKTRVGGVLGFFATARYVVLAEVPDAAPAAPPAAPAAAKLDTVEDPAALARRILHVDEEPPLEQFTPEQAFAAALARAVEKQAAAMSADEGEPPVDVEPPVEAPAAVEPPVVVPTWVAVALPVEEPAPIAVEPFAEVLFQAPAAVEPPVEDAAPVSAYAVRPAVFTRIARPDTPRAAAAASPADAPGTIPVLDPASPTAASAATPVTTPPTTEADSEAPRPARPPGTRPTAGDVVALIGDLDVIRSEAIALLRRWKVPTDTVADPGTQGLLALAMENSQALVVTGPTPGPMRPDQLDSDQWTCWRNADVPVVVLIPTAPLTRAGSRQISQQLVALGADRVLAVVDARAETANLRHWLRGFPGVGGLLAHHVGAARNPTDIAALGLPVVALDGRAATAARWRTYFRDNSASASSSTIAPAAPAKRRVDAR